MPSLQVRDLPDNIHRLLQKKAQSEHRSLAQEAVVVLAKGLGASISHKDRREALLQEIASCHVVDEFVINQDPVEFIREDRQR
jgi:plasmid stability protein